jgi:LacI family transcriptional regulator
VNTDRHSKSHLGSVSGAETNPPRLRPRELPDSEHAPKVGHGRSRATPKRTARRQKRVLLATSPCDHRLIQGITRYAEQHGWHLCPDATRENVVPWGWEGDGILGYLGANDELADFVTGANIPTVDFSFHRPQLAFARVLPDYNAVGQIAAEHFLSRGVTNYCFYSDSPDWAFEETGRAFINAVESWGFISNWLRWHWSPKFTQGHQQWRRKRKWLLDELVRMPKPLAIFAATDELALEVLETCADASISVPDEVSIMGVHDTILGVHAMHTPMSSIDTNPELVGYRGAERLDALMSRKAARPAMMRVPPLGLMARKSSDLIAVEHEGVAKCLRYLVENHFQPIGMKDLARAAGMSRPALNQAFLEQMGRTPEDELRRARVDHAKHLLAGPQRDLEEIAHRCGYLTANGFWMSFHELTGLTPREFRRDLEVDPDDRLSNVA